MLTNMGRIGRLSVSSFYESTLLPGVCGRQIAGGESSSGGGGEISHNS